MVQLVKARDIISSIMRGTKERDYKAWSFLNRIFFGVVPHAEISSEEETLLVVSLSEVIYNVRSAGLLEDDLRAKQWAMQIAAWINGVHVAHKHP